MAGNATGPGTATLPAGYGVGTGFRERMGTRLTRAYAEGRLDAGGGPGNPHVLGSPASLVWLQGVADSGNSALKQETAVP